MKNTEIKANTAAAKLSSKIGFTGKYVESLVKSANNSGYEGATIAEITKSYDKKLKASQQKLAASFKLSWKSYVALKNKANSILGDFHTGHSMGCTRSLVLSVADGSKSIGRRDDLDKYANSCKWRPTYGDVTVKLTTKELKQIRNIEGVWTIAGADGSAKWLKATGAKNTYAVVWEKGFVFENSHSTISLADAEALERRKTEIAIQNAQNDRKFIGVPHISKFACRAGIEAFCRRHNLNAEYGYQLGYLKSFNDKFARPFLAKISTATV